MIDFVLMEDFGMCVFLATVIHSHHDELQVGRGSFDRI